MNGESNGSGSKLWIGEQTNERWIMVQEIGEGVMEGEMVGIRWMDQEVNRRSDGSGSKR